MRIGFGNGVGERDGKKGNENHSINLPQGSMKYRMCMCVDEGVCVCVCVCVHL